VLRALGVVVKNTQWFQSINTVTDLLENPKERQRLGENARQFA
jgi:hypothetical protein